MTRTVKSNLMSDRQFVAEEWKCWHCPRIDTQSHIQICPTYEHLRLDKNLHNEKDLVRYFSVGPERQIRRHLDKMMTGHFTLYRLHRVSLDLGAESSYA